MSHPQTNTQPVPTSQSVMEQEVMHMQQVYKSSWLHHHLALKFRWFNLIMKTVVLAEDLINEGYPEDLFRVFTVLGTRLVSHHQAIFALLMPGRYGEAVAVSRMLLEVTALISYFGYFPEDAANWRRVFSGPPLPQNSLFQKGRGKFSWARVITRLNEKGMNLYSQVDYSRLCAAVHASEYGALFYGRRISDRPGVVGLQFGTSFDAVTAFHLSSFANWMLPGSPLAFFQMCEWAKVPENRTMDLETETERLMPWSKAMMEIDAKFEEVMAETERRTQTGESIENIKRDIEGRYKLPHLPDVPQDLGPRPSAGS